MSTENLVSVQISTENLDKINAAIAELNNTLKPILTSLTSEQRMELPKMGEGNTTFVEKALDYAVSNPEFAPPYMDVSEMGIDVKAVDELTKIYRPLKLIMEQLDDTILQSGSEAYVASLAYYNSVKMGSRMNVPDAKPIYDDLKKRFKRSSSKSSEPAA
ncbi:hypothetical protein [Reichenbachiella versicolor]|uniref:hypothetical protein n=1 Tax=Reichenbachiella versicolor TaxID=1821036 RepID=UPI000D6E4C31|nr:hypothetical protein [Reichenbachiella versicolor]